MSTDLSTARRRVVGPGEEAPSDDFYANRPSGVAARLAVNKTVLREAERKFKGADWQQHEAEILDFRYPERHPEIRLVGTISGSEAPEHVDGYCQLVADSPIYEIVGVPGFRFVPGGLSEASQYYWLERSFRSFLRSPNPTNLDTHYEIPETGLFDPAVPGLVAINRETGERITVADDGFKRLFKKIRWSTLGYQYDWTTKLYDFEKSPSQFPSDLAALTTNIVAAVFPDSSVAYKPEAGIVNYYQGGDTLTSHVDRSELNMTAPLVSLSLGAAAIFLVGGRGRDDPVRAMYLRSGDISILSGDCRHHFHGIPRIMKDTLPSHLQHDSTHSTFIDPVLEAIRDARINLNVRQVSL